MGMANVYVPPAPANPLAVIPGKRYKIFLVEMDDDDRERVIAGVVDHIEISVDYDRNSIYSDNTNYPVAYYRNDQITTLTAKVVGPLKFENFGEPVEEEDE